MQALYYFNKVSYLPGTSLKVVLKVLMEFRLTSFKVKIFHLHIFDKVLLLNWIVFNFITSHINDFPTYIFNNYKTQWLW
jgi:hypothetical protein